MAAYSDMLGIMQSQGAAVNSASLEVATMTSATSCIKGELILNKEDLMIAEYLMQPICTKVDAVVNENSFTDKSTYMNPLQSGDTVLIQRMSDTLYCIVAKVVHL